MTKILGGSYKDLKKEIENSNKKYKEDHPEYTKNKYERHHLFAQNAFKYDKKLQQMNKDNGPVIKIENEDHRLTMSSNKGKKGKEWRDEQSALLKEGNYKAAWDKGVQDIRQKCGTKYDQHINQAQNNPFKRELEQRQAKLETKKEHIQTEQKTQQSQQTQKQVFSSNQNLLNQPKKQGRGR